PAPRRCWRIARGRPLRTCASRNMARRTRKVDQAMRMPGDENDDDVTVPFPTVPVSNGEWLPGPITKRQLVLHKLITEECAWRAKWHGMTRKQFLRTAAATATAWMCMNKVFGLDQAGGASARPVKKEHCDDPAAAAYVLDRNALLILDLPADHLD